MGASKSKQRPRISRDDVLAQFWRLVRARRLRRALESLAQLPESARSLRGEVDDELGWDALHWAVYHGDANFLRAVVTELDVEYDRAIPSETKQRTLSHLVTAGCSPLHIAAGRDAPECARLLLEYKARPSDADDKGWTPLHIATWSGAARTAEVLLAHGACANTQTRIVTQKGRRRVAKGSSPLHMAVATENRALTRALIRAGGSARACDAKGLSCQDAAQQASRDFWDYFDTELEKHEMKLSFLMATQWRVGQKSPVRHLLLNGIFDPQVFRQIFTFVESRVDAYNRDFGT